MILLLCSFVLNGQNPEKVLSSIFREALADRTAYNHLEYICKNTKGRNAGSAMALKAVEYTKNALIEAGADIAPLKALGANQMGYIPDIQRYFDYHHSSNDTFEKVNIRELQMGSAAIASLIYLIDLFDL